MINTSGTAVVLTLVVVLAALLATVALLNRRDQVASSNEEIRYDDFGFAVTGSRRARSLGSGPAAIVARGTFLVLTFEVRNHAQRVPYRFDDATAVLVDDRGTEYRIAARARAQLVAERGGDPCAGTIPAGGSCTTELAFDVPDDGRGFELRLSFANAFTDLLDLVFWGRKRIRVAPG
jgi:hypothetical protein